MMRNLLMAGLVLLGGVVRGQDGSNDPTFNIADTAYGANNSVPNLLIQPDGKVIIGGSFTKYNSTTRNGIARLDSNGSVDASFNPGSGTTMVSGMSLQPDGKIIIAGGFTSYNGTSRNRIARLNIDGSLDTGFDPGTGANNWIRTTAVQPDGKILIGGQFTSYNGTARKNIARLNADGSLDTGFNPGSGANNGWTSTSISCTALQSDGKIIIGGDFTSYNGTVRNGIARLNSDGSLDNTFDPGAGISGTSAPAVGAIAIQPDGRVIIGGQFLSYNGTTRIHLARVNSDGSLDTSFNPANGPSINGSTQPFVSQIVIHPNGKVLIGGWFASYNSTPASCIARILSDGTLDAGFNSGNMLNGRVRSIAIQPDDKVMIGGDFQFYKGIPRGRVTRVNNDGSLDAGYNAHTGPNDPIDVVALQPDGKIIIGGQFTSYNGMSRSRIARLNTDGSLDIGFNPGTGANWPIVCTATQADGKIIIGGSFTSYNGTPRNYIARLNSDGSVDMGFDPGMGANSDIYTIALQPDGKILIGGSFTSYNGTLRNGIARLNDNGTLDTGFDPGTGAWWVECFALQPDGKILIGGTFTSYNGISRNFIARINSNGSLDIGFNSGAGPNSSVRCIALQADGKTILTGDFTSYDGVTRNRIARINSDGSLDPGFNPGSGPSTQPYIESIAAQPDGKVIIGGLFNSYNGTQRKHIARLNSDGSNDPSFSPGLGANDFVYTLALQTDGKIIIGGWFTSYNDTGRNRIARIINTISPGTGIRVMLEGPYTNGLMNDALRTLPSFPLTEPFTAMGYGNAAYTAGATIPASVLATTGNNAIVDWVLVEMRPAAAPGTIAAARTALLQRDGDVVALDGTGPVTFPGLTNGSYCVAVRPRNHLPVMLATTAPVNYTGNAIAVDFTSAATPVYDSDARRSSGGVQVLASGDVTFNGTVSYTGTGNDRDPILQRIGGMVPTTTVSGYWREDLNMDGVVKYTGSANDRDLVLNSVGGTTPTATRVAILP